MVPESGDSRLALRGLLSTAIVFAVSPFSASFPDCVDSVAGSGELLTAPAFPSPIFFVALSL
jgi:hypothetical protein